MSTNAKREFKKLLLRTIDENLKQIFQDTATPIIYQFLESNYSLKQEEIPEKLETFMEGLHEFFGSGAHMIEESILRGIHAKLGLEYRSKEDYRFVDCIDDLENIYPAISNPLKGRRLRKPLQKI
ncbi:MAG: hypothetical protein ACUVRA_03960 [Candidatus Bathyarchaeaceae archaeon]